jgi:catechol 2,3-dioxygenase-like lactoylglutathione lyase family enzyme
MTIELNHTIVHARDKQASAEFLGRILGLAVGAPTGPFVPLVLGNGVMLDFGAADEVHGQHYAFLVSEDEFEAALGRIKDAGLAYWADPSHRESGRINTWNGGRGVYFADPDGHNLELLTRP